MGPLDNLIIETPSIIGGWLDFNYIREFGRFPVTNEDFEAVRFGSQYTDTSLGRFLWMPQQSFRAGDLILLLNDIKRKGSKIIVSKYEDVLDITLPYYLSTETLPNGILIPRPIYH